MSVRVITLEVKSDLEPWELLEVITSVVRPQVDKILYARNEPKE